MPNASPKSPPGRRRQPRIDGWDWLRIAAAFDTAANHVAGRHGLFGFGLPLFIILSVALSVSREVPEPTEAFVTKRVRRLLIPWGFWSLMLTLERAALHDASGWPSLTWWKHEMWLYGPSIHLWFLPAIFIAGVGVHLVHRMRRGTLPSALLARLPHGFGAMCVALLTAWLLTLPVGQAIGWPFEQWLFTLPALPFGWLIGRTLAQRKGPARRPLGVGWVTLWSGAALLGAVLLDRSSAPLVLRYAAAMGALLLTWWRPTPGGSLARWFAPLMLGVYILHPAVDRWITDPVRFLLRKLTLDIPSDSLLAVGLTFVLSMAVVAVLRRTRLRTVL